MNEWSDFLPPLRQPRKTKPKAAAIPDWCKQRYIAAHQLSLSQVIKDAGHTFKPTMPDFNTANGLTKAIVNFILWNGYNAKGIDSSGKFLNGKWRQGRTRKGAADISATIKGKPVHLEIKIGSDRPSEHQLREQELERKAGGQYYFVKTFEEFLTIYDNLN